MDIEKIGKFIKELRIENNLTQKELASKLNITDRAVSKWERGKGCPDISYLEDLSNLFNISILELLKGERSEKVTSNKDVMTSLNYASKITKANLLGIINKIITIIIISIISVVVFFNVSNLYYATKDYQLGATDYKIDEERINNLLNKIQIIKQNQGIFLDEEYQEILTCLTEVENYLAIKAMEDFYGIYKYEDINLSYPSTNHLYKYILKYNIEKYESLEIKNSIDKLVNNEIDRFYNNTSKQIYGFKIDNTNYMDSYIIANAFIILGYEQQINALMEVGGINEE